MGTENQLHFALDVGTRKVAGILVRVAQGQAVVEAYCVLEHPERAMLDGQVHHVAKAAKVIAAVKAELEAKTGLRFAQAHVAVAGRALATATARAESELDPREPISEERLRNLELAAVKQARMELADPRVRAGSHCVGYAVTRSLLDGQPIGGLAGQRGSRAQVEVLATFLPHLALESLEQALRAAGLGMQSLTLEPIAALHLAIPPDLRRLNLALVDVGAGTSDVAITRGGMVSAFFMAPLAGDEVTERLVDAFVLDFQQAEILKRQLEQPGEAVVRDLFGQERRIPVVEALRAIQPTVADIARAVCGGILERNQGDPPQAVLLVGGGSATPGLARSIAEGLGLPASRVGQRLPNLQNFFATLPPELARSAWAVTPLGIALSACEGRGLPFLRLQVQGEPVSLLDLGTRPTVFDALVAAGADVRHFAGRPGLGLTVWVNGQPLAVKGGLGGAALARLNGGLSGFGEPVHEGDRIEFTPGAPGPDAKLDVAQALALAGLKALGIRLNGRALLLEPKPMLNGLPCGLGDAVPDNARLEARLNTTLAGVLASLGVAGAALASRPVAVSVNGEPRLLAQASYSLGLNGAPAGLEAPVKEGDAVDFDPQRPRNQKLSDLLPPAESRPMHIRVNGRAMAVPRAVRRITLNGRPCGEDEFLIDGADVRYEDPDRAGVTVLELLARLGLDAHGLDTGRFSVKVGGVEGGLDSRVADGGELALGLS
jgi:cell division ATPase FtsA/sulfur carrier protein ThiS